MKEHRIVGLAAALLLAYLFVGVAQAQTAGTVTLSSNVTTCTEKCTPTLTWSTTPVAASCSATWTTSKAASGSQVLAEITANKTYTMTCTWTGPIPPVTISWIPPTENTDNSPLTNLSGFKILYGTSATALTQSKAVAGAGTTSNAVTVSAAGTWFFTVRAVNAAGAESDNGNVTSGIPVTASTATASNSVDIVVNPKPKPPTNVMATVALAINIPLDSLDGFKRTPVFSITASGPGVLLGFAKIATPSVQDNLFTYRGQPYCKPLLNHPRTGAPNIAWIKGVTPSESVCAPCA